MVNVIVPVEGAAVSLRGYSQTRYGISPFVNLYPSGRASFWGDAYTPYASGRENCVQKFGNAYQRKQIEKRMPHFKSTFTTKFIKRFSEIKCSSQTMRAFLSHTRACSVIVCVIFCLRRVKCRFLRTLYASRPWFCVQLHFMRNIRRNLR